MKTDIDRKIKLQIPWMHQVRPILRQFDQVMFAIYLQRPFDRRQEAHGRVRLLRVRGRGVVGMCDIGLDGQHRRPQLVDAAEVLIRRPVEFHGPALVD